MPNFSALQRPLSEQTTGRGGKRICWTNEMEEAFMRLKEKIQEDVLLAFPDYGPEAEPLELCGCISGGFRGMLVSEARQ